MLETLRRNSRSAIIYVLFGILIAVFVISFGPGSKGFVSQSAASSVAARVGGTTLSEQDFRFAYIALGAMQYPAAVARERRLKEFVMDKLIERELLANEAQKLGFQVSDKEVEDMIADGRMVVMGFPRRIESAVFKDGAFDYENFKKVCMNQLGVSVARFIEIERRELLADKLRESLKGGVRVSPAEVKGEFEEHGLQVNLEYVRFSSRKYESDEEPAAADVAAYAKSHETELKKLYEDRKPLLYTKADKQLKLRHILVEAPKEAAADVVAKAQARVEEAKKQILGGADFATVAQQVSTSEQNKHRRGAMGWKKKGLNVFGAELDKKVFADGVKKGDLIGPERTDRGIELIKIEDSREGDISYEQAVMELAETELGRDRAKQKAKAEAQAALDRVKKSVPLEVLFPPAKDTKNDDKSPEANLARMISAQSETPQLKETGLIARRGEMVQDIGVSKELAKKAFELPVGEVAGPYEVGGSYVLVRVKEHKDPDLKDYDKRRLELEREAARTKWFTTVDAWSKQRCLELRDTGKIHVADEIMVYEGAPAAPKGLAGLGADRPYQPCTARAPF